MRWRTNLASNPKGGSGVTDNWVDASSMATFDAGILGFNLFPAPNQSLIDLGITTGIRFKNALANDELFTNFPVVSGKTYTASIWMFIESAAALNSKLRIRDSSSNVVADFTPVTKGEWVRLSIISFLANETGSWSFNIEQIGATATDYHFTALLIEEGGLSDYFDGDTFDSMWDGKPQVSRSHLFLDRDVTGDELVEQFAPLEQMYGPMPDLQVYMRGLGRAMQPIVDLASDGPDDEPGWSQLLDLRRADFDWLRWIGQWVGYYVPANPLSWDSERQRIVTRSSHRRGSIAILAEVVQEHLAEPKTVIIQERTTTPGTINVYVLDDEMISAAAEVEAAARSQKAGGLLMNFTVLTGAEYALLQASNANYTEVTSVHTTYTSVLTSPGL